MTDDGTTTRLYLVLRRDPEQAVGWIEVGRYQAEYPMAALEQALDHGDATKDGDYAVASDAQRFHVIGFTKWEVKPARDLAEAGPVGVAEEPTRLTPRRRRGSGELEPAG